MDKAVANGHLAVAQWLHSNTNAERCSTHSVDTAATKGRLESKDLLECSTFAMDGAAENGHFEVIKWLRERHKGCTEKALWNALNNGHLGIAKWLYANYSFDLNAAFYRSAKTAVENGHLDSVQWLDEHFPASFSRQDMCKAAEKGHFNVVKWLRASK
jgi:hypothetical protein